MTELVRSLRSSEQEDYGLQNDIRIRAVRGCGLYTWIPEEMSGQSGESVHGLYFCTRTPDC